MSDLVKRLRQYRLDQDENVFRLRYEAADRIDALDAENKALRIERDEAFTAGAEAMREACAKRAEAWCALDAFEIRSVAIPAQEGK